jgi:hypothetical protein
VISAHLQGSAVGAIVDDHVLTTIGFQSLKPVSSQLIWLARNPYSGTESGLDVNETPSPDNTQ